MKNIYLIKIIILSVGFAYYQNFAFTGSWNSYFQIFSSLTVSSQSQCETLCLNNAACKVYQLGGTRCNLISYQTGVSSVSLSLFSSLLYNFSGTVTVFRY